jgi:Tfp pilus assembly protein PilO
MNNLTSLNFPIKQTSAITLGFVSLSAVLGTLLWFGITRLQSRVHKAHGSITERLDLIDTTTELQSTATSLAEQIRWLQTDTLAMRAKFPVTAEESEFLKQLSEAAVACGVSVNDFRPGGIVNLTNGKILELKIRGAAPYASLCRWLAGLSELPRVVQLSQLSVTGPLTPDGDCTIDIQLDLVFGIDTAKLTSSQVES